MKKDFGFYGSQANEEWHLFFLKKNSKFPVQIENIGITHPNPNYYIKREDESIFIIEYVIKGKGKLIINGVEHDVEAGDLYVIEPHQKHEYYSNKKDPMEKMWINFTSESFEVLFNAYKLNNITVFKNTNAKALFDELLLISEKSNYSDDISIDVASVLYDILYILAKQVWYKDKPKSLLALKIKEMLDNSLYSAITLDEMSAELNYSKKQITRIFKKEYDDTPYNYLVTIKINMAKRLLRMTSLSIKEIADKLCFENQHYFSCIFKRKTGTSPLYYRKSK